MPFRSDSPSAAPFPPPVTPGEGSFSGEIKFCGKCRKPYPVESFGTRTVKGVKKVHPYCRLCRVTYSRQYYATKSAEKAREKYYANHEKIREQRIARYWQDKQWLEEYLKDKCCVDCGETDPDTFDFDHVRGEKSFEIARGLGHYSRKSMLAELAKCEIRCANCHRKRHARERRAKQEEEQCLPNTCPPTVSSPSSRPN